MQSSILILLCLISVCAACPGLFGMIGGGGGCGCSAPRPPPSPCGCGGRKKRSLPNESNEATMEFFGIAASDDDVMCNTAELKKIIVENMQKSASDSSKAINGALEVKQLQKFTVVCSENPFVFTIRADTAYCGAKKNGHTFFSNSRIRDNYSDKHGVRYALLTYYKYGVWPSSQNYPISIVMNYKDKNGPKKNTQKVMIIFAADCQNPSNQTAPISPCAENSYNFDSKFGTWQNENCYNDLK
ncbi:unnamed protein product [Caenorhabditis brenneri]